jgi:IS5 family transposase
MRPSSPPGAQKGKKQALFRQKKRHTIKTEIRINAQGPTRHVSKWHPGSVHEFTVCKQEATAARGARAYADSGYQGRQDLHIKTELPHKKFKNKGLDVLEKKYHRALSRF